MGRNDFAAAFLKGLYEGGVGNPEVNERRRANDLTQQYTQAALDQSAAEKGLVHDTSKDFSHPAHPIWDQIRSVMFPGSTGQTLQTAFKPDPNLPVPSIKPTGETTFNPPGSAIPEGQFKFPGTSKEALGMVKSQTSKTGMGNVTWDTSTDEQKRLAQGVYEGRINPAMLGFRERTVANTLANEYATRNGLTPYKSYLTQVKTKTAEAFTSGKFGQNINSLNTALGHVESVHKAYQYIANTDEKWLNVPINKLKEQTNDPHIVKLGIALNALHGELATTFKGSGGTDQEIGAWVKYLNENLTPEQAYGALTEVDDLLRSRQSALEYQRSTGMGDNPGGTSIISPKAAKTQKSLQSSPLNTDQPPVKEFNSLLEATAAKLPKGTRIKVGGRMATVQ